MPLTGDDLDAILAAYPTRSAEQTLDLYRKVRDQILGAAYTEHGTIRIIIRNREHTVSDPEKLLARLEKLISFYEEKVALKTSGASRNYARLNMRRRPG